MKAFVEHNKVTIWHIWVSFIGLILVLSRNRISLCLFLFHFSLVIFLMDFEQIHGLFLLPLLTLPQASNPYQQKMKIGVEMEVAREEMADMIFNLGLPSSRYWLAFLARLRRKGWSETAKPFCFIVNLSMSQYSKLLQQYTVW